MPQNRSIQIIVLGIILVTLVCLLAFPNFVFSLWYPIHIAPEGESVIEMLVDVNATEGDIQKLEKIAKWEAENIDYIYKRKEDIPLPNYPIFLIDGKIKIRALKPPYNNDPKWIAYYKVGGCGELASFFSEVANRAGFETRVVRDSGIDHAWVEVKLNGTWVVADPTIYWWYINDPKNHSGWDKLWFNNKFWCNMWSFSRIVTQSKNGTPLDLTANYTKTIVPITPSADRS